MSDKLTASDFRTWLSMLAEASATLPAREVLRRLPPTDPNEAHHVAGDMTLAQVANEVGRATSTIRTWLNSKRLQGYKLNGRDWRVPRSALRTYVGDQRHLPNQLGTRQDNEDISAWRRI